MTSISQDAEASDPSYIDYEIFLDPDFSPHNFANTLVLTTNNPTDTPLDLSTPLSKVLFDIQEVDSHIHSLTSTSALPLLTHTQSETASSTRIVDELAGQIASLNDSYERLEKDIIERYEVAEEIRRVSERLWHTVRLGRSIGRALQLGRQLEIQLNEVSHGASGTSSIGAISSKIREDHRAMTRAANTVVALNTLFAASEPGEEGEGLAKVNVIISLRNDLITPGERSLRTKAFQIIREFSMSTLSSSTTTFAQTEETKLRTTSALTTLYVLSSMSTGSGKSSTTTFEPDLLISALQEYLRTCLTSSIASLTRSLGALPSLDRTLLEISARCQNIIALEALLESTKPSPLTSPSMKNHTPPQNFLQPLLTHLETASLPSNFWRSLASALSPRVQELVAKGGVQARTLKSNKNSVREAIRECVLRGTQPPAGSGAAGVAAGKSRKGGGEGWEREVAVMVGAVVGHLGR